MRNVNNSSKKIKIPHSLLYNYDKQYDMFELSRNSRTPITPRDIQTLKNDKINTTEKKLLRIHVLFSILFLYLSSVHRVDILIILERNRDWCKSLRMDNYPTRRYSILSVYNN